MKQKRTIIYTAEQRYAILAVAEAGADLRRARAEEGKARERAKTAVERALTLGIHYKELEGLPQSFTYRVLKKIAA